MSYFQAAINDTDSDQQEDPERQGKKEIHAVVTSTMLRWRAIVPRRHAVCIRGGRAIRARYGTRLFYIVSDGVHKFRRDGGER
jgi:hypothetical protein